MNILIIAFCIIGLLHVRISVINKMEKSLNEGTEVDITNEGMLGALSILVLIKMMLHYLN